MEILSDATFKGNVSINGGAFFVTPKGYMNPLIETTTGSNDGCYFTVHGSEFVNGDLIVNGGGHIELNNSGSINYWSDLNNILDFAPKSLSTTVSSNTSKINSACSTISSLCTKVNSLCTTVSSLPKFCSITLPSDVPADCTRFTICAHGNHPVERAYYMFMTKGTNPMSPVNIDLEARCDSTTYNNWSFVATKSSGFEMKSSDGYVLKFFIAIVKVSNVCASKTKGVINQITPSLSSE